MTDASVSRVSAPSAEVAPVGDKGKGVRRGIAYFFMIAYALLMFVPFAWMVITSFKTQPDAVQMTFIPNPFTTEGWQDAFGLDPSVLRLFFNSALIAGVVTLTNVTFGAMAGYAFARLRFP